MPVDRPLGARLDSVTRSLAAERNGRGATICKMFYMAVYFILAYGLVALLLTVARRGLATKVSGPGAGLPYARLMVPLMLLPMAPYIVVAVQTAIMLPELRPAMGRAIQTEYGNGAKPRIVRVLRVRPAPVIYAVLPCRDLTAAEGNRAEVGCLYTFRRTGGVWEWDGVPDCAWSECGSADGNTFPPYPEAKEF